MTPKRVDASTARCLREVMQTRTDEDVEGKPAQPVGLEPAKNKIRVNSHSQHSRGWSQKSVDSRFNCHIKMAATGFERAFDLRAKFAYQAFQSFIVAVWFRRI